MMASSGVDNIEGAADDATEVGVEGLTHLGASAAGAGITIELNEGEGTCVVCNKTFEAGLP